MRKNYCYTALLLAMAMVLGACMQTPAGRQKGNYVMVIHGGAGTILKKNMTPEKEAAYKSALETAT